MTAADLSPAQWSHAWLFCVLAVCIALWIGAELHAWWKRRRAQRLTVARIEPRCERAGSQAQFGRIVRARGNAR